MLDLVLSTYSCAFHEWWIATQQLQLRLLQDSRGWMGAVYVVVENFAGMFSSLRKDRNQVYFLSKHLVFKRLCRQTASLHLHHLLSLTLRRGKPRMEHKNVSLCVSVSNWACLVVHSWPWACMFTRETARAREKRKKRKEKLNVLKPIPSVSCC